MSKSEKSFKITLKRCTEIEAKWNKLSVHVAYYISKGASHKKLWKSPSVEVSHSVADFAKVAPYILVVKDKGKPKSTIITLKLNSDSKKITKWKVDIADFWNKGEALNTILYTDKGPRMIVTIVDAQSNMQKVKSEFESSSQNNSQGKMPLYTPTKKPKKSMVGKLKDRRKSRSASDWSDSDSSEFSSDWESSSECEYETKMAFEQASCEDPDLRDLGPIKDKTASELPQLNFDLSNMLNGAFIRTDGVAPMANANSSANENTGSSNFSTMTYVPQTKPEQPASFENTKSTSTPSSAFRENTNKSKKEAQEDSRDSNDDDDGSRSDRDDQSSGEQDCRYCIIV